MSNKYVKKQKMLALSYLGWECKMCGLQSDYPEVYDFHHLNPDEKNISLSCYTSSFLDRISELDKCVVLCSNCHRILHTRKLRISQS